MLRGINDQCRQKAGQFISMSYTLRYGNQTETVTHNTVRVNIVGACSSDAKPVMEKIRDLQSGNKESVEIWRFIENL